MTTRNSTGLEVSSLIRHLTICAILAVAAGCESDSPTRLHSRIGIDRSQDNSPSRAAMAEAAGNNSTPGIQGQGAVGTGNVNGTGVVVPPGATGGGSLNVGPATASGVGVNAPPGIAQINPGPTTGITTSSGASLGTGISGTGTGSGSSVSGVGTSTLTGAGTPAGTSGVGAGTTSIGTTPLTPGTSGTTSTSLLTPTTLGLSGASTPAGSLGTSTLGGSASPTPGTSSLLTPTNQILFSTNIFGPH